MSAHIQHQRRVKKNAERMKKTCFNQLRKWNYFFLYIYFVDVILCECAVLLVIFFSLAAVFSSSLLSLYYYFVEALTSTRRRKKLIWRFCFPSLASVIMTRRVHVWRSMLDSFCFCFGYAAENLTKLLIAAVAVFTKNLTFHMNSFLF